MWKFTRISAPHVALNELVKYTTQDIQEYYFNNMKEFEYIPIKKLYRIA